MPNEISTFKKQLALKGFSASTQQNYFASLSRFLTFCNIPVDKINSQHIQDYLYYLLTERKLSNSAVRNAG